MLGVRSRFTFAGHTSLLSTAEIGSAWGVEAAGGIDPKNEEATLALAHVLETYKKACRMQGFSPIKSFENC